MTPGFIVFFLRRRHPEIQKVLSFREQDPKLLLTASTMGV